VICGLLRTAGLECVHRQTQSGEQLGGALEVLVHEEDLEVARSMLASES
jgi:hypothetical protein